MSSLDIIIILVCSGFLLLAWRIFRGHRTHVKIVSYRRLYMQAIARIETIVVQMNQLSNLAEHVKEPNSFRYYEESVAMLESLLIALNRIPPLSDQGELVRSMEPMIGQLEHRVEQCRQKFRDELNRRKELSQLFKPLISTDQEITGCYFCSKPYSPRTFKKVTIRFQGQKMDVYGCSSCRAELRSRKAVDILYFVHKDRSVHWSELPGYDPKTDFWTLGSRPTRKQRPQLELVSLPKEHD